MHTIQQITDLLSFYRCPCSVVSAESRGTFADYELQPENGTTIKKLLARVEDFSLLLGCPVSVAVEGLRLILRVESGQRQTYNFFDYSQYLHPRNIALGITPDGGYLQTQIEQLPHLLVAGATGSGKSVFIHNVIISLAIGGGFCFTLIDLKRVELTQYNGCGFLSRPVVTDPQQAERVLLAEVEEMQARYRLMERYKVRNYKDLPKNKSLNGRVIVIDELADLMLNRATRKSVENSIVRLAQLGRACGIHLVLATQRPSTDVITGLIKANIPSRVAFMTASGVDSRVIGVKGAENLRGKGDGLFQGVGDRTPQRFTGFYIDDATLTEFLNKIRHYDKQNRQHNGLLSRLFRGLTA